MKHKFGLGFKKPVRMDLFMSFLTVNLSKVIGNFGNEYGYTEYNNNSIGLIICGRTVDKIEYLDSVKYKKNLHNKYNNFVNAFYLFDIMNNEGKIFFMDYYDDDIEKMKKESEKEIKKHKKILKDINLFQTSCLETTTGKRL